MAENNSIGYSFPAQVTSEHVNMLNEVLHSSDNRYSDFICDVYGSTQYSIVGHSRFPRDIPDVSMDAVEKYVDALNRINIPFYFVMNNLWLRSRENNEVGRMEIYTEMKLLVDMGISGFILANPALIIQTHKWFPDMELTASINLELSSVPMVSEYLRFGANKIVVGRDITRDFSMLRVLAKKYSDHLVLLANSSCIMFCPLSIYHSLITGHESMKSPNQIKNIVPDEINQEPEYCMNYCHGKLNENPAEILKIPWIRPEDIKYYTSLGINLFKIQGRQKSIARQKEILLAYMNRQSPHDDFFFLFPSLRSQIQDFVNKNRSPYEKEFNFEITNSDLEKAGFMDYFLNKSYDCRMGCEDCGYCERIFRQITERHQKIE